MIATQKINLSRSNEGISGMRAAGIGIVAAFLGGLIGYTMGLCQSYAEINKMEDRPAEIIVGERNYRTAMQNAVRL